jgi:hypothetical protein
VGRISGCGVRGTCTVQETIAANITLISKGVAINGASTSNDARNDEILLSIVGCY